MSRKQFILFLFIYSTFLLLGATIFYFVETKAENVRMMEEKKERENLREKIRVYNDSLDDNSKLKANEVIDAIEVYCSKPIKNIPSQVSRKWDAYNALFFVLTVVSTIGYGNLSPSTMFSRIFMIFYGLVGIPMNGILMVTLGDFFGKSFTSLYNRWKSSKQKQNVDGARLGLIAQIILYLVPGFTFFVFVPSIFIMAFENWNYDVAVYYSFVTLTTIGFGDYVAGQNYDLYHNHQEGFLYSIYQIGLLIWIIGGLGYVVMILNFISRGMQSKKLRLLEEKITANIMKTPHRIRQELRSVLQEFLINRVKKVYKEFEYEPTKLERSQSCPDLSLYVVHSPSMKKRALSVCPTTFILQRIQSETDLERIDVAKTFQDAELQTDLLLKVVDALSDNDKDITAFGAYDGFSDSQILATERSNSSNASLAPPNCARKRAISEVRYPLQKDEALHESGVTWYGQAFTQQYAAFARKQAKSSSVPEHLEAINENVGLFKKLKNTFKRTGNKETVDVERQQPTGRKKSLFDAAQDRRASVLETTTIADLMRALTAINDEPTIKREGSLRRSAIRSRRAPIKTNILANRRCSLMPNFLGASSAGASPKPSSSRRGSLVPPVITTTDFSRVFTSPSTFSSKRLSLSPLTENLLAPPPSYLVATRRDSAGSVHEIPQPSKIRKFSIRPTPCDSTPAPSLVKRKGRTDSQ